MSTDRIFHKLYRKDIPDSRAGGLIHKITRISRAKILSIQKLGTLVLQSQSIAQRQKGVRLEKREGLQEHTTDP